IAQPAIIESHCGNPLSGQVAGQVDKLPVRADAVLRPAHDHQDAGRRRMLWLMHDTEQCVAIQLKGDRCLTAHEAGSKAAREAAISAVAHSGSCSIQNCGPETACAETAAPCSIHASTAF